MSNLWFRLYSEFAFDPKIQSMSETFQRRYIMLLCLQCNDDLEKLTAEEIAFALRIPLDELEKTKELFISKGFIDDQWKISNWDKRQYKSDSSSERVRRFRDNKKDETLQKRYCNGSVTPPETDTDTDTEEDKHTSSREQTASTDTVLPPDKPPACPHQKIIELYHQTLPQLPQVKHWGKKPASSLSARWKEDKDRQSLGWWKDFFIYVSRCPFLMGEVKEFRANLSWLIGPNNFCKVLNGQYEPKRSEVEPPLTDEQKRANRERERKLLENHLVQ